MEASYAPFGDPENSRKWRDCCCHTRTSMYSAAVLMILMAILSFATTSPSTYYSTCILGFLLLADGILAILALRNVRSDLIGASIVLTSIILASNVLELMAIFAITLMLTSSTGVELPVSSVGIWVGAAVFIVFVSFNIWFLVVSFKCRAYLDAKQSHILANAGIMSVYNFPGPFEVISNSSEIASQRTTAPPVYSR